MDAAATYARQVRAIAEMLAERMVGLDDRLAEQPGPRLNPAGFIVWHILRVWDHDLRDIRGLGAAEDIWRRLGLSAVAGYEPAVIRGEDGVDYADGFGYSMADVLAVPYARFWLERYRQALLDETLVLLEEGDDVDRAIYQPGRATPTTPAEILDHLVLHSAMHIGELQMTRGLLGLDD